MILCISDNMTRYLQQQPEQSPRHLPLTGQLQCRTRNNALAFNKMATKINNGVVISSCDDRIYPLPGRRIREQRNVAVSRSWRSSDISVRNSSDASPGDKSLSLLHCSLVVAGATSTLPSPSEALKLWLAAASPELGNLLLQLAQLCRPGKEHTDSNWAGLWCPPRPGDLYGLLKTPAVVKHIWRRQFPRDNEKSSRGPFDSVLECASAQENENSAAPQPGAASFRLSSQLAVTHLATECDLSPTLHRERGWVAAQCHTALVATFYSTKAQLLTTKSYHCLAAQRLAFYSKYRQMLTHYTAVLR
ncbi:hypothetical protein CCM_03774 [Cordyceps militaris CM01]|uniref:Uncharacterized protein n=1 Tax=Cordyceps militaris (strain CM01) TaxID=983644 RepID=G3JGI4_CORMM|nr:uncharacterized protein CCM_03774 [Cordyceps militaris CM01]EGX92401.1 hypothetical protein CCM_03774 [Cordyceps militaris CM01]